MPWSQPVHLSLGPVTMSGSTRLRVLAQAPRLRDCDLVIISSSQPPSRLVLVHSLKCLLLEGNESGGSVNVTEFLAHVQLSELISLAIVGERTIQLLSFLSRSSCSLRRLILVDTPIFGDHMRHILRHKSMGKLTSLKLERCSADTDAEIIYLGPVQTKDGYPGAFFATLSENDVYSHSLLPGAPSMGETFTR
ncbi:hypothetical protein C8R45DRAFT_1005660 [Mycena sanguinolenta]|nr:hypothetical protein C8R45DRAFT_1005660 [Mycena sanguinolenta]